MSNTPTTNKHQEEIDLGYLINKFNTLFKNCVKLIFALFAFILQYKILFFGLLLLSIIYGYYKDSRVTVSYNNQAIVIPNFESVDYLYNSIEALNSKLSLQDTIFLKEVFGNNFRQIKRIEIEPIVDIYNFVSKSREHIDVFRILFQNQELSEFIKDMATSKYYKYHKLSFTTVGEKSSEKIIYDVIQYFNSNEHFLGYQEVGRENTRLEITENTKMIAQIDSVFKAVTSISTKEKGNQSVFINDYNQLDDLLTTKRDLLEDRMRLLMRHNDESDVIKLVSANYNLKPRGFYISNKIKYPFLLIFIFSLGFFTMLAYKKLKAIAESN